MGGDANEAGSGLRERPRLVKEGMRAWWFPGLGVSVVAAFIGCSSTHSSSSPTDGGASGAVSDAPIDAVDDALADAGSSVNEDAAGYGAGFDGAVCWLTSAAAPGLQDCANCLQVNCCAVTNACFGQDGGTFEPPCSVLAGCIAGCANGVEPGDGGYFDAGALDSGPVVACADRCTKLFPASVQSAFQQYNACFTASCVTICSE